MKRILNKLQEFKRSKEDYIEVDFNKTICQKKLFEQGYEIVKDQFKMLIVPVSFRTNIIDHNFIETNYNNFKSNPLQEPILNLQILSHRNTTSYNTNSNT